MAGEFSSVNSQPDIKDIKRRISISEAINCFGSRDLSFEISLQGGVSTWVLERNGDKSKATLKHGDRLRILEYNELSEDIFDAVLVGGDDEKPVRHIGLTRCVNGKENRLPVLFSEESERSHRDRSFQ